MGQQISRKATFTQAKGVFTPVNKRAKTVAKKAGKRTRVTLADLQKLAGSGSYVYYVYTSKGALKPIEL